MKHIDQNLQAAAASSLQAHFDTLAATPFALSTLPSLSFDQRGAVAGSALLNKNHIKLNAKLLQKHQDFFLAQVLPHELAHLAVFAHFGRVRPHGHEWQTIMSEVFLLPPDRCHNLPMEDANIRMFLYECDCQTVQLSIRRHNKVERGKVQYVCKSCRTPLTFKSAL